MSRPAWSLFNYQLIEPDEQLDLFACQEVRVHLVTRQLELGGSADRTLCGSLLPAQPRWSSVDRRVFQDLSYDFVTPQMKKYLKNHFYGLEKTK